MSVRNFIPLWKMEYNCKERSLGQVEMQFGGSLHLKDRCNTQVPDTTRMRPEDSDEVD